MSDLSNAKCIDSHTIKLVSEGYAICYSRDLSLFWPWSFSRQVSPRWHASQLVNENAPPQQAWVGKACNSEEDALLIIKQEINLCRSLPFNEERERSRLMLLQSQDCNLR
jgi:hypothetical protein